MDFLLGRDDEPYCLEVNTIPGMTPTSLVPMAAKAAGMRYDQLVAAHARAGDRRRAGAPRGETVADLMRSRIPIQEHTWTARCDS